ncbi:MAG: phosphatase PAP2 family protein [Parafilimonas sp.]
MKKLISFICLALLFFHGNIHAQDSTYKSSSQSPYKTSFKVDGPVIAAGIGLSVLGLSLIQNKDDLTDAQLQTKTRSKVPFFDHSNAGQYSEQADNDSYIPFYVSFGVPVVMMIANKNERQKVGQILVLYTETMAITSTLFTLCDGLVNRSRPFVYSSTEDWHVSEAPDDKRKSKNSQRSFYAGHTAASAAATFFAAKVFQDFNPDSKAKLYVWIIAAAIPASVGYLRYKAGDHFLSDNLLGYVIGGATGILVPQLHKIKAMKNVTVLPGSGDNYKGLTLVYHIQ